MTLLLFRPTSYREGAEELDSEALESNLSILSSNFIASRLSKERDGLDISIYKNGRLEREVYVPLKMQMGLRSKIVSLLLLDPACIFYLKLGIAEAFQSFADANGVVADTIVTSNSALLGISLSLKTRHRITRSVNFEPRHYWQENPFVWKKPLVFLAKLWSTFLELITTDILPISPNDLKDYNRYHLRKLRLVLPLQQLQDQKIASAKSMKRPLQVGFLGSTYTVTHNKEGFQFVVNELAMTLDPVEFHFNIYGVKSPDLVLPKNVTIHGWVNSIDEIFDTNDVFVVPYSGGTGQQSKLFQPLARGKLVISDPRAFAGYPFRPSEHYLEAHNAQTFADKLCLVSNNKIDSDLITSSALKLCNLLFNQQMNIEKLQKSVS